MAGIWILEPDEKLSESLSTAIRKAGLATVTFRKGSSALSAIKKDPPGLIILDLAIDDGKGLALCHSIRGMPGVDLVPILFLGAGEGGVMSFGDALAEGGDYFFSKPPDTRKVVSKILTYVGIDRDTSMVATTPTSDTDAPSPATNAAVAVPQAASVNETTPKDEQATNLAGRVEQMLNLGKSFKEGLLGPPDATEDADTRLARLEQEIVDEGIRTEASRATMPLPSAGKTVRSEPPASPKEIISESVSRAVLPTPAAPEKVPGGVVLQAPVGTTNVAEEESAEAVFAKLAAELFEEKPADTASGKKAAPVVLSSEPATKPSIPSPKKPESRHQVQKPKTIAKRIVEDESRKESPPPPSIRPSQIETSAIRATEAVSAKLEIPSKPEPVLPQPKQPVEKPKQPVEKSEQLVEKPKQPLERPEQPLEKPEQRLEQKESVVVSQLPPHPPTSNALFTSEILTKEIQPLVEDKVAEKKTVNPPRPDSEKPREDHEPTAVSEDTNARVQPLRPTLVRRTYHQRRKVPSPEPEPTPSEPSASAVEDEPAKQIDELFIPKPAPAYQPPDPESSQLSSEAVPFLLWRLHTQNVTGKVLIRSGSNTKTLFFENGIPVGAHSSVAHERLEELLLREGLLDRAAYTEARVKDLTSPRQLAAHLVERGWLRANELFPIVRRHLEEGVIALFEWDTGTVTFENDLIPDMEKVRLPRPLAASIMAGIRRKFLLERLIHELGGPASLIAPTPKEKRSAVTPDSEALGLTRQEREIFHLVNGLRPIEEIVFISGCDAVLVYRVLFAGVVTGLLTVVVKGIRPSEEESEARERELAIGKRRIEAKLEHVNRGSYFDILGVSEKASPYEIEQAYQRASREFHPVQFAHPSYQHVASQLALIRRTLDEAYEVLSDDLLREDYRRSLSSASEQP